MSFGVQLGACLSKQPDEGLASVGPIACFVGTARKAEGEADVAGAVLLVRRGRCLRRRSFY